MMLGPVEMVCELAHASRQFKNASQQKGSKGGAWTHCIWENTFGHTPPLTRVASNPFYARTASRDFITNELFVAGQ
jgi:hypothetical protein